MSNSAVFDFDDIRRRRNIRLGMEPSGRLFSADGKLESECWPADAISALLSPFFDTTGRPKNWRMAQHLSFGPGVIGSPGKHIVLTSKADMLISDAVRGMAKETDDHIMRILIDGPYSVGGYAKRPAASTSAWSPKVGDRVHLKGGPSKPLVWIITEARQHEASFFLIEEDAPAHNLPIIMKEWWLLKHYQQAPPRVPAPPPLPPWFGFVWKAGMPVIEVATGKRWTIDAICGDAFRLRFLERDNPVTEWRQMDRANFLRDFIQPTIDHSALDERSVALA